MDENAVRFVAITKDNWLHAIELRVKPSQYVYMRRDAVLYSLAKAYVSQPGEYWPYVIEEDGKLVGAIRLPNYGRGVGFAAFFIDHRYQGQGLGRKALAHLVPFVKARFPQAREIETSVHRDNAVARRLHENLGMAYTGVASEQDLMDMEMQV